VGDKPSALDRGVGGGCARQSSGLPLRALQRRTEDPGEATSPATPSRTATTDATYRNRLDNPTRGTRPGVGQQVVCTDLEETEPGPSFFYVCGSA
jgi:hypothetical protein